MHTHTPYHTYQHRELLSTSHTDLSVSTAAYAQGAVLPQQAAPKQTPLLLYHIPNGF